MTTTWGAPDFQDTRQPQPSLDRLKNTTIGVGNTSVSFTTNGAQGIYEFYAVLTTPPMACLVEATASTSTVDNAFTALRYQPAGGPCQFIIPAAGFLGDTVSCTVSVSTPVTGSAMPVQLYGLRVFADGLRFDGLYPAQNNGVWTIPAATGTNLIGSLLPSPQRALVGAIIPPAVLCGAAGGVAYVQGAVNGTTVSLATGAAGANGAIQWATVNFGDGILLDAGTTPTCVLPTVAQSAQGSMFYDLVT